MGIDFGACSKPCQVARTRMRCFAKLLRKIKNILNEIENNSKEMEFRYLLNRLAKSLNKSFENYKNRY